MKSKKLNKILNSQTLNKNDIENIQQIFDEWNETGPLWVASLAFIYGKTQGIAAERRRRKHSSFSRFMNLPEQATTVKEEKEQQPLASEIICDLRGEIDELMECRLLQQSIILNAFKITDLRILKMIFNFVEAGVDESEKRTGSVGGHENGEDGI